MFICYIKLVSYQKSEKTNDWLPRNAQNANFSHPYRHFWQFFFFFKKPTLSVFRNLKKLPWYQKSEKKTNEPFEWNLNLIEARGRGLQ